MGYKWHKLWILMGMLLVSLASCDSTTEVSSDGPGEFEQTWPKSYGETTCAEWFDALSAHERRVAAADMLVGAQESDGGDSLPSDELIRRFQDDISAGCQPVQELSIAEIAATVYTLDTSYLP